MDTRESVQTDNSGRQKVARILNRIAIVWLFVAGIYLLLPGLVHSQPVGPANLEYWVFLGAILSGALLCQRAVTRNNPLQALFLGLTALRSLCSCFPFM